MSLLPSLSYANPTQPLWLKYDASGNPNASNVNWIWADANSPGYSPLQTTATASPSPAYTFLQARRSEPGPNPTQTFYGRFDGSGNAILEYAWDGFVYLPWTLNGRPVIIQGDNTSVLTLKNEQTGATGNFTIDASNNLYWNGTQLN